MRSLISPIQMITNHCFPLLRDAHTHTHTQTHIQIIYPFTQLATNKFVRDTRKGKHLILGLSLLISSDSYISSSLRQNAITVEKERGLCFICPWEEERSHPQWPPLTTVSATDNTMPYLSVFGGEILLDSGSWWWMRHRKCLIHISHFQEQTIQTSEMNFTSWRYTGGTNHLAGRRK